MWSTNCRNNWWFGDQFLEMIKTHFTLEEMRIEFDLISPTYPEMFWNLIGHSGQEGEIPASRLKGCFVDSSGTSSSIIFTSVHSDRTHLHTNSLNIQQTFVSTIIFTKQLKTWFWVYKNNLGIKREHQRTNLVEIKNPYMLIRPPGQWSLCQELTCQRQKVLGMCPLLFFCGINFNTETSKWVWIPKKMPGDFCLVPTSKKRMNENPRGFGVHQKNRRSNFTARGKVEFCP